MRKAGKASFHQVLNQMSLCSINNWKLTLLEWWEWSPSAVQSVLIGFHMPTPRQWPPLPGCLCGRHPQRRGCRDDRQRASEAAPASLRWTPSPAGVLTVPRAKCQTKGESCLCKRRWMSIPQAKGQGTLWLLSQLGLPPKHTHQKHVIQNNINQLWECHLGFTMCDSN